jgi:hypothetical protein
MKRRMSFRDAMDMVPNDLPDGAFFAMAREIAGMDYGDGFSELAEDHFRKCEQCGKVCSGAQGLLQHQKAKHWSKK